MKIIWPNNITAVSATSEVSTYEDDMVLNSWPGAVWKANATTAQDLTLTVAAPDAVHIGYTNFSGTLAYTAYNSGDGTVESGNLTAYGKESVYHYWYEPAAPTTITSVKLTFPIVSTAVTVGIARAGTLYEFGNPEYGMGEDVVDYSVSTELNNGAWYTKDRSIVNAFDCEIITERATDGSCKLANLSKRIGVKGFSVMITDNPVQIVFGHFDGKPNVSRDFIAKNKTSFSFVEAV